MFFRSKQFKKWTNELNTYKEVKGLETFNILHIYPTTNEAWKTEVAEDSLLCDIWIFNSDTGEKRLFANRVALIFKATPVITKIFIDGSTLIDFNRIVKMTWVEAPVLEVAENIIQTPHDTVAQEKVKEMESVADEILANKKKK